MRRNPACAALFERSLIHFQIQHYERTRTIHSPFAVPSVNSVVKGF
jgi:hypothetical protein